MVREPAQGKAFYARKLWTLGIGGILIVGGVFLCVTALALNGQGDRTYAFVWTPLIIGGFLSLIGIAQSSSGLFLGSHHLYIINLGRVHRIHLSAIEHFSLERWRILPRACVVRLRTGRRVGVWSLPAKNPMLFAHDTWAESVVDRFNSLLDGASSGEGGRDL
jgi:hypothetical protein